MRMILVILIAATMLLAGCSNSDSGYTREQLDSLANCLADKNVKEYGAFWCPNCAKQEKMFGSSHEILRDRKVYVECDPRCILDENGKLPVACRGIEGMAEECLDKGIDKYPTWDFPNGDRLIGVQEFNILAEKAGCVL